MSGYKRLNILILLTLLCCKQLGPANPDQTPPGDASGTAGQPAPTNSAGTILSADDLSVPQTVKKQSDYASLLKDVQSDSLFYDNQPKSPGSQQFNACIKGRIMMPLALSGTTYIGSGTYDITQCVQQQMSATHAGSTVVVKAAQVSVYSMDDCPNGGFKGPPSWTVGDMFAGSESQLLRTCSGAFSHQFQSKLTTTFSATGPSESYSMMSIVTSDFSDGSGGTCKGTVDGAAVSFSPCRFFFQNNLLKCGRQWKAVHTSALGRHL